MSKCSDADVLSLYLQGHQDEVFVLEAHPTDPRILLSAGAVHYLCQFSLSHCKMIQQCFTMLDLLQVHVVLQYKTPKSDLKIFTIR